MVWSRVGPVRMSPERTMRVKLLLVDTCQRTLTSGPVPEPGLLAEVGVTRVQMTTELGRGSPLATP